MFHPLCFLVISICVPLAASSQMAVNKMLSSLNKYQDSYPLPSLPYKYNGLEPWIDEKTVKAHHTEIHGQRTKEMNDLLREWRKSGNNSFLATSSLLDIIANIDKVPEKWREPIRNNVGGYLNHIICSATLSPNPTGEQRNMSKLMKYAIDYSFLNFTNFQKSFNVSANDVFSTGYVWLVRMARYRTLTTYVGLQEATPITVNYQPILGIDLWEHAHFTKYGNDREEYIRNWWKVVDFDRVEDVMNWWWSMDTKHEEL